MGNQKEFTTTCAIIRSGANASFAAGHTPSPFPKISFPSLSSQPKDETTDKFHHRIGVCKDGRQKELFLSMELHWQCFLQDS